MSPIGIPVLAETIFSLVCNVFGIFTVKHFSFGSFIFSDLLESDNVTTYNLIIKLLQYCYYSKNKLNVNIYFSVYIFLYLY